MDDSLFRSLDLIQPGDLVQYHGSIPDAHGLYIVEPCRCFTCRYHEALGSADIRYRLRDPWDEDAPAPRCVRRQSITRSATCG